jgi:hypothetical protein
MLSSFGPISAVGSRDRMKGGGGAVDSGGSSELPGALLMC